MMAAVHGGMLGLTAFLLAFSLGIVVNQHGERKSMVVTEANAIGTAVSNGTIVALKWQKESGSDDD